MAVVTVSHTRNGKALLNYVLHSKPHHPDKYVQDRNMYVSAIDCPITDIDDAMSALWQNTNCKNQLFSVVQSFRDLDYRNLDNVKAVHEAGLRLAKQLLEKLDVKRQVVVATQTDGSHHLIHNHILINNVDENGRGIPHGIYCGKVMDLNDQIVKSMNTQETDVQDELIEQKERWCDGDYRHSYEPDNGVSKKDKRYNLSEIGLGINNDLRNKHNYRTDKHDKLIDQENNKYIIDVVTDALAVAQSKQQFVRLLDQLDVTIKLRKRQNKINWSAKNLSFVHKGHKRAIRSTTINKKWTADYIQQQFERNRLAAIQRQQEQELTNQRIAEEVARWQQEQDKQEEVKKMQDADIKTDQNENIVQATSIQPNLVKEALDDWPVPVNITSVNDGCIDPESIENDDNDWDDEHRKFEREIETYRNKSVIKYKRFDKKQSHNRDDRITFQEFFAFKIARHKHQPVLQFLKSLVQREAQLIARRLNKLVKNYLRKLNHDSAGDAGHKKELLDKKSSVERTN